MLLNLGSPVWVTNGDTLGVAQKLENGKWLVKFGSTVRQITDKEFSDNYIRVTMVGLGEPNDNILMES